MKNLSALPTITGKPAGKFISAETQNNYSDWNATLACFLQIFLILPEIISSALGLEITRLFFNSLKNKLFRITKAYAFVESPPVPDRTKTLIYSGNSPGGAG